jgi:hypothetical protein
MQTFIDGSTGEIVDSALVEAEIERRGSREQFIKACVQGESFVLGLDMRSQSRTSLQRELNARLEADHELHLMPLGWQQAA